MKPQVRTFLGALLALAGYGLFFAGQEKAFQQDYATLKVLPTTSALRILTGYGRQLAAEMAFVQASVFLGGLPLETDPRTYTPVLAHNYKTIAELYPEFIDTYYHAQSYLAGVQSSKVGVNPEATRAANDILAIGRTADPHNLIYPFFQGFNCFSYLQNPKQAARIYHEASLIPGSPPAFAHLSALMSAQGGELAVSLYSLQILRDATDDRERREMYSKELEMVQQAIEVQKAVDAFTKHNQHHPATLAELVPEYITQLPDLGSTFELTWNPPNVGLKRPDRLSREERRKATQGSQQQARGDTDAKSSSTVKDIETTGDKDSSAPAPVLPKNPSKKAP